MVYTASTMSNELFHQAYIHTHTHILSIYTRLYKNSFVGGIKVLHFSTSCRIKSEDSQKEPECILQRKWQHGSEWEMPFYLFQCLISMYCTWLMPNIRVETVCIRLNLEQVSNCNNLYFGWSAGRWFVK